MSLGNELRIFPTLASLSEAACLFVIDIAKKVIESKKRFVIALSGGRTPELLYSLLANSPYCEQVEWKKTFIFWSDERCVPFNDMRNNARMAKEALLDKIDIPSSNIHRIPVNLPPADAAKAYENEIKQFFAEEPAVFNLILLGLGENGHTASLFPGTTVLNEKTRLVKEVYIEEQNMFRITMTVPLINQAEHLLFLVIGEEKAKIINEVLAGSFHADKYPAQLIKPVTGKLYWFIDSKAASEMIPA